MRKDEEISRAKPLTGLIAATYTPLNDDGTLNLSVIEDYVEYLIAQGVKGLYVCGSTGEGMSLSCADRRLVTEAFLQANNRRVPVIVQVGHNSLDEACELARHAEVSGADVVSATCPSYFKVNSAVCLADCMAEVASAAAETPFYYYHIPMLTGADIDMVEFLALGENRIPNLAGLKYTSSTLHEFQACQQSFDGLFDIVWGLDEMLLGALATGATAAIGSTYNIAARLYARVRTAFDCGDFETARKNQLLSIQMVRALNRFPFHSAMKVVLGMKGLSMGPCRLPQEHLSEGQVAELTSSLDRIGYFDWSE